MIQKGNNIIRPVKDVNQEFSELEGELTYEEAQATLAEFFYHNPAMMIDLLAGIKIFPFQEMHIKGWMRNDFSMIVWGRGLSKTLVYNDTSILITKEKGMISLPNLFPDIDFSHERWIEIPPVHLWNGEGWRLMSKIYVQPQKNCQRVRTRDGFQLEGSTNHLVKILNPKTLAPEWKRYHEIKIGDYVCISRQETSWGENVTQQQVDEAYLIGLLIGDGCYAQSKKGVGITSADEEILSFVEKFPHCKRYKREGSMAVSIDLNKAFGEDLLKRYGMSRGLSYTKSIPAKIQSNKTLLTACLKGLFDTDGMAMKNGGVSFSSVSELLSHQVQVALLSFGIVSVRKWTKTSSAFGHCYVVRMFGKEAESFKEKIGFGLRRKMDILISSVGKTFNTNLDVIPGAKEYAQKEVKSKIRLTDELSREWRSSIRRKNNQKHLTYSTLEKYINFFKRAGVKDDLLKPLLDVWSEHFYYSPVTEMDTFVHDCIDFNVPHGERYWSNGFISHNTWSVALFALLWALYNPKNRIVVISFSFRASRGILDQCYKFVNEDGADLFRANFPDNKKHGLTRSTDIWEWTLPNGASIKCLPLGDGTKIRGQRADTLVVDEFAFLPEAVVGTILQPFLVAKGNIKEQQIIREIEGQKIAAGEMKEEDRTVLEDFKKVIFLSSACFQFEHMYKRFCEWVKEIQNDGSDKTRPKATASYFVSRLSYEVAPSDLVNMKMIEDAKKNTSEAVFAREYEAQFTPDSGGYFRASKMKACTVEDGTFPTLEIIGEKGAEYVVAIDVALSGAEDSDHFAISVMKIVTRGDDGRKIPMLVHSYAIAGGDLKGHILYFYFILKHFNAVYIAIDASQGDNVEFLNSAVQSKLFQDNKIHLCDLEVDFKSADMKQQPLEVRRSYNLTMGRIVQKQPFLSHWQKAANEYLQGAFDHKSVLFGSKMASNKETAGRSIEQAGIALEILRNHSDFKDMSPNDFVELQDHLVDMTKSECAMVQVSVTAQGTQQWALPQNVRRSSGPNRMRKDNYSSLLLGVWATKIYLESQQIDIQPAVPELDYRFL